VINVTHIFIYPIKSLQGVELDKADVLQKGFKYDRRWMIVDSENLLVTQRTHPKLSQIKLEINGESIILGYEGKEDITIPLILSSGDPLRVTVWNDEVDAISENSAVSDWISSTVGMSCKLVFMPENGQRLINPNKARNGEHVSFADGYPYLVLGQASLDDLNSRLDIELPMNRFRPNIVVKGTTPYEEDSWVDFKIGDLLFYGTGACKRCVFTTIDQVTGQKGAEPLKTLATFRKEGKEVIFGLNAIATDDGVISVGDELVVV
jgi:uncharacterized protein YcbX